MKYKTTQLLLMLASGAGIVDTLYLVNSHYNDPAACTTPFIESFFGIPVDCGQVTTSQYSTIFGLPISLFGLLYYLTFFAILFFDAKVNAFIQPKGLSLSNLFLILSSVGFLVSTILLFLQVAVLKLVCLYCMGSVVTSYTLFGVSLVFWRTSS